MIRRCTENSILCSGETFSTSGAKDNTIEIFDGYQFEDRQLSQAHDNGSMVVRINDFPGTYSFCDVLICHGPQANTQEFVVDENCRRLLGPKYALIHPGFYERSVRSVDRVKNLFISFGGGASDALLSKIISLAASIQPDLNIEAVRGFWPSEDQQDGADAAICGPLDQDELATKMAHADAAITAGGGMCLETTAMGLPTFLVALSDNQIRPCEAMQEQGLAFYSGVIVEAPDDVDAIKLHSSLAEFLAASVLRKSLSDHCNDYFDNSGIGMVAAEILAMAKSRGWSIAGI